LHAQWDLPSWFLLDSDPSTANIIEEEIFLYEHNFLNLGVFSFLIVSLPNPPNLEILPDAFESGRNGSFD
jgi:hypothetical protein